MEVLSKQEVAQNVLDYYCNHKARLEPAPAPAPPHQHQHHRKIGPQQQDPVPTTVDSNPPGSH